MSRVKTSLNHKRIRRLVWLALTVFVLLGYSLGSEAGSAYYSMVMQAYGMVSSPPVILEAGTAGTSTIYMNNTSAKVSVSVSGNESLGSVVQVSSVAKATATVYGTQRKVLRTTDANNTIHVFFVDSSNYIKWYRSIDNGLTFSLAFASTLLALNLDVTKDNTNNIHLVYEYGGKIYYRKQAYNAAGWGTEKTLDSTTYAHYPSIAIAPYNNSWIYVVYDYHSPQVVFVSAGAGAAIASTAALNVPFPAGLQANDLLLMQITIRDLVTSPTTPSGWTLLYGPDAGSTLVRQWIFYKFATGSETGNQAVTAAISVVKMGRMYAFRNVNTTTPFVEGGGFGRGTVATISAQSVTTAGPLELAVSFVFVSDDNAVGSFTGETGGDWTETVAEFVTTLGSHGCIQLQGATMASAGTISGGTYVMSAADQWGVRAFALKPAKRNKWYFTSSTDSGSTWSSPVDKTLNEYTAGFTAGTFPSIIIYNTLDTYGHVYVVWFSGNLNLYLRRGVIGSAGAITWDATASTISSGMSTATTTVNTNMMHSAVYVNGKYRIVYCEAGTAKYRDWNETTWSTPIALATVSNYPSLTYNDNNYLYVFYQTNAANANYDIRYQKSTDTTPTGFGSAINVTDDNTGNHYVNAKVGGDNSRLEFIWTQGTTSPFNVKYNYITFAGGEGDFDYVLKVVNVVLEAWEIRLKAYDQSNIGRLNNCTIYLHNGGNLSQIIIISGEYTQQMGDWYDLAGSGTDGTDFIAMHIEATTGTSYIYVYLEIRIPSTSTYARYIITFEITK